MSNKAARRQRAHQKRLLNGQEKVFQHNMRAQRLAFARKLAEAEYIANGGDPASPFRPAMGALKFLYAPDDPDEPVGYADAPLLALLPKGK